METTIITPAEQNATQTTSQGPRYIVRTAQAKMPRSCWGAYHYRKITIVDTLCDCVVSMWDRVHQGTTDRCEYARVMIEARKEADGLNADYAVERMIDEARAEMSDAIYSDDTH